MPSKKQAETKPPALELRVERVMETAMGKFATLAAYCYGERTGATVPLKGPMASLKIGDAIRVLEDDKL